MSEITTEAVPNQYIVSFKRYTPEEVSQEHLEWAKAAHTEAAALRAESGGPELTGVGETFTFPDWSGYVGSFDESLKAEIEARDEVDFVEPDYIVTVDSLVTQKPVPSWGLARLSSKKKLPSPAVNLPYTYYSTAGEGIRAYVLDTGIMIDHEDFGGRAKWGYNAVSGSADTDKHGHGTHVAGIIGGTKYGVAKKSTLIAVKVLGDTGGGTISGIISGVQWALNDAQKSGIKKSVANMSLSSSKSASLNAAVAAAIKGGLFVAVAAGNQKQDAGERSPASEILAFTVGSIDITDSASSFSNFGKCLDIYAPGGQITSAALSPGKSGSTVKSGTSMASPHIAGLAACLIAKSPTWYNSPDAIGRGITGIAIKNSKVTPIVSGTTSLISYNGV